MYFAHLTFEFRFHAIMLYLKQLRLNLVLALEVQLHTVYHESIAFHFTHLIKEYDDFI